MLFAVTSSPVIAALTNEKLWSTFVLIALMMLLGFVLTRGKYFGEKTSDVLTKIVLNLALPCLAFTSFMNDISNESFKGALFAFVFGFIVYPLFIYLGKLLFLWVKDPTKRMVLALMFTFGTTTFFAQPLIQAVFGDTAYNDSNMFNIAYRLFMYPYAYVCLSGISLKGDKEHRLGMLKKIFLNPIIIATLLGFLLWSLQLIGGSDSAHWWTLRKDWLDPQENGTPVYVPFWRFDVSLPWLHKPLTVIASLASPLIYLAMGCVLGSTPLKEAFKDPLAWSYSLIKMIVGPAVILAMLALTQYFGLLAGNPHFVTMDSVNGTAFMWVAPPSVVVGAYCLRYDKEKELAAHANLVGTLVALLFAIVWVYALSVLSYNGFFA